MPGMIQFRGAILDDAQPLIVLCERTIDACYREFLGDELVNSFISRQAFREYTSLHLGHFQLLNLGDELVGFSVCKENQIDLLMIDPRVQGYGLGTQLLEHSEQLLFRSNPVLGLKSFAENRRANAFFRKHGWEDTVAHTDKQSGVREILFRKYEPSHLAVSRKRNWRAAVAGTRA